MHKLVFIKKHDIESIRLSTLDYRDFPAAAAAAAHKPVDADNHSAIWFITAELSYSPLCVI